MNGGERITLTGSNFGPVAKGQTAAADVTTTVHVTYGPATGEEYTAVNCGISVVNTEIQCDSAAGVGGPPR